jgi:PAS domain S-box-containing protein
LNGEASHGREGRAMRESQSVLRRSGATDEGSKERRPPGDAGEFSCPRILVLGDNSERSEGLASILEILGYDVMSADSRVEAEELIQRRGNDLVILDFDLHAVGIEALRRIKDADPGVGAIIISGEASRPRALEAFQLGADAFIGRPIEPDILEGQIADLIEAGRGRAQLRVSEEGLLQLLEDMGEGVFECDLEGHLTSINRAGALILGYEAPEEALREPLRLLEPGSGVEASSRPVSLASVGGERRTFLRFEGRQGDARWIEAAIRSRRNGEGAVVGFEGVFRDATRWIRRLLMLDAIHRAHIGLERSESVEEVGELMMAFLTGVLGAEGGYMAITDGETLSLVAERGEIRRRTGSGLRGQGTVARAVITGETQTSKGKGGSTGARRQSRSKAVSEMAVPVRLDGCVIAVIYLYGAVPDAHTDENRVIVEILSEKISSKLHGLTRSWLDPRAHVRLGEYL